MTRCPRCGLPMERHNVTQRYCVICIRELALTVKPEPTFVPTWRRKPFAKDLTRWAA